MRESSGVRFLWLLLAWIVVVLISARIPRAAAQPLPGLSTSNCATDSECQKNYKCFVQDGVNSGFCVPTEYSGSKRDEEVCLHRANCAAAAALRHVCPACVLTPIFACGGITGIQAEGTGNIWARFKDCFTPTPEQIPASTVQRDPIRAHSVGERSNQNVNRGGPKAIEQLPDLGIYVNAWNITVPAGWAGSWSTNHWSKKSKKELYRRKGRVEQAVSHLWQFNDPCPIFDEDMSDNGGSSSLVAGTCGAFRNPDPTKPPPHLTYIHK
jgi:hypothetical protein